MRTLLMSLSLLLRQFSACLVLLLMVWEMGDRWSRGAVLKCVASKICSRQYAAFLCSSLQAFS